MDHVAAEPCSAEEDDCSDLEVSCLMRLGRNSGWLRLFENAEVTVGRGVNVTYQLLSATCPLMISRLHCTFKTREDGRWTVTDKKSLNGVWVNGSRIPPEEAQPLSIGDAIQLGVPLEGSQVEFNYVFVRRPFRDVKPCLARRHKDGAKAVHIPENSKRKLTEEEDEPSTSKPKLYRRTSSDKSQARACPLPEGKRRQYSSDSAAGVTASSHHVPESKQISNVASAPCELDHLEMFSQNIELLKEQVDDTQRKVASLEGEPRCGDPQVRELQGQLRSLRSKMQQMETLRRSFSEKKTCQEDRKTQQQEEQMKKQLDEALQEQSKVLNELAQSRQAFEKILTEKNQELEVTKEEKEKARAQKEEVVTQVTEVLENELQCIICSELFIEAVTLNCAHSFCSYCIKQWRKKKDECPICRQAITSQSRCLALDNFIERMMENLSLDIKSKRESIVNERKATQSSEVMVIHDDDSSRSSDSTGSMVSINSSLSSVVSIDTDSSVHSDFDSSDDSED